MHRAPFALRILTLAFVAWLAAAPPAAFAQAQAFSAPVVAVLDFERIMQQSAASKSMRPQIEKIRNDYRNEVKDQENALRKAEQDLAQQRSVVSVDVFTQKRREFEDRARQAQTDVHERKRVIDEALAKALDKIKVATEEIARDLANERKIDLILPRAAVFLMVQNLDVTNEIMKRLDAKLPNVAIALPGTQPAAAPKPAATKPPPKK